MDRLINDILEKLSAPPKTAPTTPKPSRTIPRREPRHKPRPFNPPKPARKPAPKAELTEDFESGTHPSIARFWKNIRSADHPFAKHPITALYGLDLAKGSWQDTIDRLKKIPEFENLSDTEIMHRVIPHAAMLVQKIMQIESMHEDELESLAKRAVSAALGIPEDQLVANLGTAEPGDIGDEEDDFEDDDVYDEEQINKRLTMNMMTQGGALHTMMTVHHLVRDELDKIDKRLLKYYDALSPSAVHHYWAIDINSILGAFARFKVGDARVSFKGDQPIAIGSGIIFPILVQELAKAALELVSLHGFEGVDDNIVRSTIKHADKLEHEPFMIQIGPDLWRIFLKIVPKGYGIADAMMHLARRDPKTVHKILSDAIEDTKAGYDPEASRKALQEIIDELEDEGYDIDYDADYDEYEYE